MQKLHKPLENPNPDMIVCKIAERTSAQASAVFHELPHLLNERVILLLHWNYNLVHLDSEFHWKEVELRDSLQAWSLHASFFQVQPGRSWASPHRLFSSAAAYRLQCPRVVTAVTIVTSCIRRWVDPWPFTCAESAIVTVPLIPGNKTWQCVPNNLEIMREPGERSTGRRFDKYFGWAMGGATLSNERF